MWRNLTEKYPVRFAYCCVAHALHLLVRDIISPSQKKENNPAFIGGKGSKTRNKDVDPMYPPGFCFEELIDTISESKLIVQYFRNHHDVREELLDLQRENHDVALAEQGDTRWGTLLGKFYFEILFYCYTY